jgi:hypothetical protein
MKNNLEKDEIDFKIEICLAEIKKHTKMLELSKNQKSKEISNKLLLKSLEKKDEFINLYPEKFLI